MRTVHLVTLLLLALGAPVAEARKTPLDGTPLETAKKNAREKGSIRVIVRVRLDEPWKAEGMLTGEERGKQRKRIRDAQANLLRKHGGAKASAAGTFESIPHLLLEVDERALERLAEDDDVIRIDEEAVMNPTLAESVHKVSAPQVWDLGHTGSGQVVVVLDSGVEGSHPFLNGKVVQEACFSRNGAYISTCPSGATTSGDLTTRIGPGSAPPCTIPVPEAGPQDPSYLEEKAKCNHGTLVSGVAVGKNGSFEGLTFSGVAKDASLLPIQVFVLWDCGGGRTCTQTLEGDQLRALEYVYNTARHQFSIAAINISLAVYNEAYNSEAACANSTSLTAGAYADMVQNLRSVGIAVVGGTGNQAFAGVSYPACLAGMIAVGASSKDDRIWPSSNSGTLMELWAPGTGFLEGGSGPGATGIVSSLPGGSYQANSGTSLATPHVAGAFAVLRQKWPIPSGISLETLISAVTGTGPQLNANVTRRRLDLFHAYYEVLDTTPPAAAPANVAATATGAAAVRITWSAVTDDHGIDGYRIERRANVTQSWSAATTVAGSQTMFDDTTVAAGKAYQYRVVAIDFGGNESPASNVDIATTVLFSDDPLVAGATRVYGSHVDQLRQAIDAWRELANLSRLWTNAPSIAGSPVRASDLASLFGGSSTPYDAARAGVGKSPFVYTGNVPVPESGTRILRQQIQQLRDSLK